MHHPDAGPVLNGFYEQVGPPVFDTDITLMYIRCDERQHVESAMADIRAPGSAAAGERPQAPHRCRPRAQWLL